MTIASLIPCFKHWPGRRVNKNTAIDRQMRFRLHQTVRAQINSCSPEGIQRCTKKFPDHRVRCAFSNMNQQAVSESLHRTFEIGKLESDKGGENTAWPGRTNSRFSSADLRPEMPSTGREVFV